EAEELASASTPQSADTAPGNRPWRQSQHQPFIAAVPTQIVAGLFRTHVDQYVVTLDQIVGNKGVIDHAAGIVGREVVQILHFPQGTTVVIGLGLHKAPAVLLDQENPLAVSVTGLVFAVRLNHPDATLFPAQNVRIDMVIGQYFLGAELLTEHVIRND